MLYVRVYARRTEGLRNISQEAQSLHISGQETRSTLIDFNAEMTTRNKRVRSDIFIWVLIRTKRTLVLSSNTLYFEIVG